MPTQRLKRTSEGPAVYTYTATPGLLSLGIMRLGQGRRIGGPASAHSHDFLALAYFEESGGALRIADREWQIEVGDVYIAAPGEVIGTNDSSGLPQASGWAIFFPPEVLGPRAPGGLLSWHAHPLLFPFVRGTTGGAHRLQVPPADRMKWSQRIHLLDDELSHRRDGYRDAALAYLTLLLVDIARLVSDVTDDLKLQDEPLLSAVFGVIDQRYCESISLADVAWAVNLSPGYLTTLVRRKTGRTVLEWITERRMTEARRLLVETDLAVEEIGGQVGFRDAGYFTRSFARAHGTTPVGWRRASRP